MGKNKNVFKYEHEKIQRQYIKKGVYISKKGNLKIGDRIISNIIVLAIKQKNIQKLYESSKIITFALVKEGVLLKDVVQCPAERIDRDLIEILQRKMGLDLQITGNIKDRKVFIELIKSTIIFIKKFEIFDFIGWTKLENKYVYFDGQRLISDDKDIEKIQIESSDKYDSTFGINNIKISEQKAFDFTQKMLKVASNDVTYPMFLFSLLSVLQTPLSEVGVETNFLLWIYGATGTRKTTLSKLFFNVLRKNKEIVDGSFKDTIAAIQFQMSLSRDCCTFFDDGHPTSTQKEKNEINQKISFITRSTSDGSNKKRMTQSMDETIELKSQGNVAVTAEDLMSGESSVARAYVVELNQKSVNLKKLTKVQKNINNYSTFIYNFLKWFSSNYEEYSGKIKFYFNQRRKKIGNTLIHGRIVEQIIQFESILLLYLKYARENNFLSLNDINKCKEDFEKVVNEYFMRISKMLINEKPLIKYFHAFDELIASNRYKISKLDQLEIVK